MKLTDYLDRAKDITGSDYATSQRLGVRRQLVSKWRNGEHYPDLVHGARLAVLIGVKTEEIAAAVERQRGDQQQDSLLKRYAAALLIGVCTSLLTAQPTPASAATATDVDNSGRFVYYDK